MRASASWTSTRTPTEREGSLQLVELDSRVSARAPPPSVAIVPAWNEAGAIGGVIDEGPKHERRRSRSSSSTTRPADDTAAIAEAHGATVLRLPLNVGIGGAVQTGFRYALEERLRARGPPGRRWPARRLADPADPRADRGR